MQQSFRARAPSNIALVKYWGKRAGVDPALNLPAVGSISISLKALHTTTTVTALSELSEDQVILTHDGKQSEAPQNFSQRVRAHLTRIRREASYAGYVRVETENNFPTGAGLASSASGFAALTLAASRAMGLEWNSHELSRFARIGSGSAARSMFGGFAEMPVGVAADGSDCAARSLADETAWPLKVLVAITAKGPKTTGSTEGMIRTARTAPFYQQWLESQNTDLDRMRQAIRGQDFDALAEVTEHSALKMHGLMLSTRPGLLFWNGATVEVMHRVRAMREKGLPVCFTVDAGPQVKIVCDSGATKKVRAGLRDCPGLLRVMESGLGPGAHLLD